MILSTPGPSSAFLAATKPSSPFPRVSKLFFLAPSHSLSSRFRSTARRSTAFPGVLSSLNLHAMAELVQDKEVFASAEADSSKKKNRTRSRSFLDAATEQELLSGISKEAEAGKLPSNVAAGMKELYQNYKTAVLQSGIPNAHETVLENMAVALDLIFLDVEDPFIFSPYHKALRKPLDYYDFGQKYIRPLIDFRNSYVGNVNIFNEIQEKLQQGHNIVFISNHQTEADPAVIALLLETSSPHIAENLIYVAGDRVVTDPLCKPFSMGRNLICVYSKKHMNDDPEHSEEKRKANIRSLKEMALLLRGGSQVIWIAPSGGRDRPDPLSGEWFPAHFDASSVDNMRRLAEHSGAPGHVYPLALLCYDIMPPPPQVEREIGERRVISFHGVGLSVAPEISFSEVTAASENPEEAKEVYTEALYKSVTEQYNVLKSAVHGKQGLGASTPTVSLSQPWN
ncbi:glycerol-3-phosphate acyltransferase [Salix suchowensis]|nr:glycerol-3-phosphate acyltransferase [Salix suchowensis]